MTGSSTLRVASMDSKLWKPHYEHRYTHAEAAKENDRRNIFGEDWRKLYHSRRRLDHEALKNLRIIEAVSPEARIEPARRIAHLGLDIWDVLSDEASRPSPPLFQTEDDIEKVKNGSPLTNLTRKYWAAELKKIIARRTAIDSWTSLSQSRADEEINPLPFEEAFATLSCFHGVLPDEIMNLVNREIDGCKRYLETENICCDPGAEEFVTSRLCTTVCEYMRAQGFDKTEANRFYDVRNSLPHLFLTSFRHCLPISLVFIFVAIVKSLGVKASALNTPNVVIALVHDRLVDVCGQAFAESIATRSYQDVEQIFSEHFQRTITSQLLSRVARNIEVAADQELLREVNDRHDLYQDDNFYTLLQARYMAHCLTALTQPMPDKANEQRIFSIIASKFFPLDMDLVVLDKVLTHWDRPSRLVIMQFGGEYFLEDDDNRNLYKLESRGVLRNLFSADLFVGQIVSARNFTLRAVIGWKTTDEGIVCSTISYYHNYVKDYPIDLMTPTICTVQDLRTFLRNPILGQYFEDAEFCALNLSTGRGRGRFIMNKYLRNLYPEDEEIGARWIRSG
ncbi:uncharacterized protein FOMMEDRAFT_23533 [Fomitiporia mediterranea MF3/22]|uniref:uncharacterized protein n=1 Tax=Fomitiporia mediterranea (strain MF3/22) TaxID=694068 RepID=UPI00044089E5|nr:uncharacterized protein FOMMEDRAFT_23533 [Fomitiporia mediterranea MF3/22]EJC98722.1 hypothetical protein FOMMEDRAFT_23533 [Fomitiporia mediterranea MF3/22]